ncbi:TetR family transcriptional regulator [Paenibacillus sp. y28]|uniref:TetR family transcriptional regulator n=1 Tax=Paenibacillus sp. y28 TaxID=3129110 RepID=UPI00301A930A
MTQVEPEMKMRILLAAKKLFARQGYDGTSVRQICEEAGANVALVSYYFGGKENVFSAMFSTFIAEKMWEELEDKLQEPVQGIRTIIRQVQLFKKMDPELESIIHQEMNMTSPRVEHVRKYQFRIWRKVRQLLERGREEGIFHFTSLDHTVFVVMGCIIFQEKMSHAYFEPLKLEPELELGELIEQTCDFVLNGLGVPKSMRGGEPDYESSATEI